MGQGVQTAVDRGPSRAVSLSLPPHARWISGQGADTDCVFSPPLPAGALAERLKAWGSEELGTHFGALPLPLCSTAGWL